MKHTIQRTALTSLLLVAAICNAAAQGPPDMPPLSKEKMDEIRAQKSAYITTKLSLTPEQAQQFWPIYNAYDQQQETLRKEMREMHRTQREKGGPLTEAQASEIIAKNFTMREKDLELERTYAEKFKKSMGAVKTVELHRAERDFHREVLRRVKERMGDRKDGPQRDHRH